MQLSVSTGKNGLIQRTFFHAFGDSSDHTSSWPLNDVVVSLNRAVHDIAVWIWQASGTWEYDDWNQTDLPRATTDLVASQQDYTLPTTTFKVLRVEVLDDSGNWHKLHQIDQSEVGIALTEFMETAGLPRYYDVIGQSLFLYPAPASASVTLTAGLRIYIARESTEFTVPASYTTADTTQPGFDEPFHELVCLMAAFDWVGSPNGPKDVADRLERRIERKRIDLFKHMGDKNRDKKVGIRPRMEDYGNRPSSRFIA